MGCGSHVESDDAIAEQATIYDVRIPSQVQRHPKYVSPDSPPTSDKSACKTNPEVNAKE